MIFLWIYCEFHRFPMNFPEFSKEFPDHFLRISWVSYEFPKWISYEFHEFPKSCLSLSYEFLYNFLKFLWIALEIPMNFLVISKEFARTFFRISCDFNESPLEMHLFVGPPYMSYLFGFLPVLPLSKFYLIKNNILYPCYLFYPFIRFSPLPVLPLCLS